MKTKRERGQQWYAKYRESIRKKQNDKYKNNVSHRSYVKKRTNEYRLKNKEIVCRGKRKWFLKNKDRLNAEMKRVKAERVKVLIYKLGGKCSKCGFDKVPALQIHHLFRREYKRDFLRKDYDLSKLILLCANCHCLLHYENSD